MRRALNPKDPQKALKSMRLMLLCLFVCFAKPTLGIETNFPSMHDSSGSMLGSQEEQIIGESIIQKIHGTEFFVSDPVVNEYLRTLALKFSAVTQIPNFKLDFFAVKTPEINAFAFFGNHVAVHSGLILAVANEQELAAVLAHETAHITQRHLARILQNNQKMLPLTLAEILAAAAIGTVSPEAGMHLATAAYAGHIQKMINYTREHEQEADRIGMQLLARAHFDPTAMASVFQRMKQQILYHEMPPEYLLTHPLFDARIADAQNRADSLTHQPTTDSLLFSWIRGRLEADRSENATKKIHRLKETANAQKSLNKTTAQYAYALALLQTHKPLDALPILQNLNAQYPNQWAVEMSLADAEAATQKTMSALQRLERLQTLHPKNYAIILQYASLLLKNNQADKVIKLLLACRKEHFNDPMLHQLLARAYSKVRKPIELHRAQAEWHFARGEFKEAYQQLEIALEHTERQPAFIKVIQDRKAAMQAIEAKQRELKL